MKRWTGTYGHQAGLRAAVARPAQADDGDPAVDAIVAWLSNLRQLNGVPFYYLVPDVRMLPPESLRFFTIDENWISCLVDGAFSIGNTTAGDGQRFATAAEEFRRRARDTAPHARARKLGIDPQPSAEPAAPVSGFLLRSAVIFGWPGLEVRGLKSDSTMANLLRFDRIGDVLLCLFDAPVVTVRISEPAEALHCGVDLPDHPADPYTKGLKYVQPSGAHAAGTAIEGATVTVPFRDAARRVIAVEALQAAIKTALLANGGIAPGDAFTSAELALEMVEGVQEVDFQVVAPAVLT